MLNQQEGKSQNRSVQRPSGLQALLRNRQHCKFPKCCLCTVLAEPVTTNNSSCLCQSPLRRCTIGTCELHGETAKAQETPKHFSFDQCGQQGCNFYESSMWGSWNLSALLAKQSQLVTSMGAGMRFKELTSSPGQLEELANSVRQIPGVCGDLPSLCRKQITAHDADSSFPAGTHSEVPCRGATPHWMPERDCVFPWNLSYILGCVSTGQYELP